MFTRRTERDHHLGVGATAQCRADSGMALERMDKLGSLFSYE